MTSQAQPTRTRAAPVGPPRVTFIDVSLAGSEPCVPSSVGWPSLHLAAVPHRSSDRARVGVGLSLAALAVIGFIALMVTADY